MPEELPAPADQPDGDEPLASAWDEVAYSVAELIKRKEVREALKKWIDAQSENIPKNHSFRVQALWSGVFFSLTVFGAIIFLGIKGVIKPEVMVGLLGPLLGYWFGRRSNQ